MRNGSESHPRVPHSAFRIPHSAIISALVGMALYAVTLGGTWVYDDIYHLFNDDRTQLPEVQPGSGLVVE